MWPRALPPEVLANPLRATECEVYRGLEAVLESPFAVFYSRPWFGIKPDGEEIDGEADFVIAHPELGMLVLEVKGGAVAYDATIDQWISTDRWGITHKIKDPVRQARTSKHQLLAKLARTSGWSNRRIRARHGVALPDSAMPRRDLGPDRPLRIFCFADQFEKNLAAWIRGRMGDSLDNEGREEPLGPDGMAALEELLARPFRLKYALRRTVKQDDRSIDILTQQQFHILQAIVDIPRVAISGAAGTGKTVLAIEEAMRCAESEKRTLLTCYSRALAADIRRRVNAPSLAKIASFHELCYEVSPDTRRITPDAEQSPYNEEFTARLIEGLRERPEKRFDAIIVDEGQDFVPTWWQALEGAFDPNGPRLLRVFYDSNQHIYGDAARLSAGIALIPIRLTRNLRNTRRIHAIAQLHYRGYPIQPVGPEGQAVEWVALERADDVARHIQDRVAQLIRDEGFAPTDICILAPERADIDYLAPRGRMGGYPVRRADALQQGAVTLDTIRHFKGLESLLVIMYVTHRVSDDPELAYVGVSRARAHMILVGKRNDLRALQTPVRAPAN